MGGLGDVNSGPLACVESTLLTEPFPRLQIELQKKITDGSRYCFSVLRIGPCEHFPSRACTTKALSIGGNLGTLLGKRFASSGLDPGGCMYSLWEEMLFCLAVCLEGSYSMTLQPWQWAQEPLCSGPPDAGTVCISALHWQCVPTPLAHLVSTLTLPVSQKTFCCSVPGTQLGNSSAILGVTATPSPGVSASGTLAMERGPSKFVLPRVFLSQLYSNLYVLVPSW